MSGTEIPRDQAGRVLRPKPSQLLADVMEALGPDHLTTRTLMAALIERDRGAGVEPRAITPTYGWHLPVLADPPNVPYDMQENSLDIEAAMLSTFANAAARDAAIPAPTFGMVCQLADTGTRQRYNGYVWVGDASLTTLAMSNGWTGANHAAIDADGNVELHLYAGHTGATSNTLCTLPAKYWPISGYSTLRFPAYCINGTAREVVGLTVSAAGVVSFGWSSGSYSAVVHVDAIVSYRGAFLAVR